MDGRARAAVVVAAVPGVREGVVAAAPAVRVAVGAAGAEAAADLAAAAAEAEAADAGASNRAAAAVVEVRLPNALAQAGQASQAPSWSASRPVPRPGKGAVRRVR